MRNALVIGTLALLVGSTAFAKEATWTGKISDSNCGAAHKTAMEHGKKKMSDADCTRACVKGGAKYVLVHEGKVIPIANQDFSGLEEHAGQTVRLTGEMTDGNITVAKIEKPAPRHKAGAKKPS